MFELLLIIADDTLICKTYVLKFIISLIPLKKILLMKDCSYLIPVFWLFFFLFLSLYYHFFFTNFFNFSAFYISFVFSLYFSSSFYSLRYYSAKIPMIFQFLFYYHGRVFITIFVPVRNDLQAEKDQDMPRRLK